MWTGAGGWSPSLLLGKGSGNKKKFCKASGSLLGGGLRKVSCSSWELVVVVKKKKKNPTWLAVTLLGLVLPKASSSAVGLPREGLQPWGCGVVLHLPGLQLLIWNLALVR